MCGLNGSALVADAHELTPEPLLEKDGLKVSKSPWGARRRDRPAQLDHAARRPSRSSSASTARTCSTSTSTTSSACRPGSRPAIRRYEIWMTHTPQGSIVDGRSGSARQIHQQYSYCGDAISMYTHCGTHIDTLNHIGLLRHLLERVDAGQAPRQPDLEQGRPGEVPAGDRARRPARHRRDEGRRLPAGPLRDHADRTCRPPEAPEGRAPQEGRRARPDRPHEQVARLPRIPRQDARHLVDSAKYLCEQGGAMCIAGDTIGLEVLPGAGQRLPAGARLHVRDRGRADHRGRRHGGARGREAVRVRVPRLPAEARGATGAPMPSVAAGASIGPTGRGSRRLGTTRSAALSSLLLGGCSPARAARLAVGIPLTSDACIALRELRPTILVMRFGNGARTWGATASCDVAHRILPSCG